MNIDSLRHPACSIQKNNRGALCYQRWVAIHLSCPFLQPTTQPGPFKKLLAYLTNPDNVGTVQCILAFNTLALSGSYWVFKWFYGVDPMTYTMQYQMSMNPDAFEQDTETTAAEFALVEVRSILFPFIVKRGR